MPPAAAAPGTLSPELASFLTQLSVTLHKHRAYPEGHPMRVEATDAVRAMLAEVLEERPVLRIGVARHALIVGDESSDEGQPVLSELAERLHRRQIGAIVLKPGVTAVELELALERMNVDPRRADLADPRAEPEQIGEHVELIPMSYGHLAMAGGASTPAPSSSDKLWEELARLTATPHAALGAGGSAVAMAEALRALRGEKQKRADVMATLERFGKAAAKEGGSRGELARRELAELLSGIPKGELASLLDIDLTRPDGIERLLGASEWLALPALIDLVESAAATTGQTVSHFLLRLMRKLSNRNDSAGPEPAGDGDSSVREAVQSLLRGWSLNDPNPGIHTQLLEELSRRDRNDAAISDAYVAGGERVVRMALEVAATGVLVYEAVDGMLENRQLATLLDLLDETPESNDAVVSIWKHLVTPAVLRRVLLEEPVDQNACVRLLSRVPLSSADGLLDSLTISESQGTRWLILRRLSDLGPEVGDLLVARLDQAPWYLKRNLLGLLADLPKVPAGFTARRYADETEPLLRLEALRLMMRSDTEREDAIHRALADPDDRVVRAGLESGTEHGLPKTSLPRLMKLLNDLTRSAELRARGVALLVQFDSPTVRQWIVERSVVKRGWFRRTRLASKSPDLVAGIIVLFKQFKDHPQSAEVLRLASESNDPEILTAVGGGRPV